MNSNPDYQHEQKRYGNSKLKKKKKLHREVAQNLVFESMLTKIAESDVHDGNDHVWSALLNWHLHIDPPYMSLKISEMVLLEDNFALISHILHIRPSEQKPYQCILSRLSFQDACLC